MSEILLVVSGVSSPIFQSVRTPNNVQSRIREQVLTAVHGACAPTCSVASQCAFHGLEVCYKSGSTILGLVRRSDQSHQRCNLK
jgi:hypothetical protein